jgi:nucleoside-diphosphate-sugar epimerase
MTDTEAVSDLVAGAGIVVHLAGPPSVAASFDQPREYARAHVMGTATLLEACRGAGVSRLVHVSSAEIYAQPSSNPVDEQHRLDPRSPYGAAKLGAEYMVRAMAPVLQMEAAVLRPFSVYGPGAPARSLVGSVIRQALTAPAVRVADLRPVRDYCFVNDAADAVVRSCRAQLPEPVSVYNVGSGHGVSVDEIVKLIIAVAGTNIPVVNADDSDRPASATVTALVASTRRAADELGWEATTSLADGIAQTVAWARQTDGARA